MEEWMQYAKDMAKAEKELKIEQWVIISFYRVTERGEKIPLFKYDLPRRVGECRNLLKAYYIKLIMA